MSTAPQVETLRAMEAHLRQASLPQSPLVRVAIIPDVTREEIADRTYVTILPGVPSPEFQSRNALRADQVVDVAIQRALPTATDASGQVRDLDWHSVAAMMELQRALLLALAQFPRVQKIEGVNSGPKEHAQQGVWTSVYRVTIHGETERW